MCEKMIFQDNNSNVSVETLYCIGGYVTYEVAVATNGFSGVCTFCIEENTLKEYIEIINSMLETLNGIVEIQDCESDAYIKLFFENDRNFYVLGQINGSHNDNTLKFKIKADQTLLRGLKRNMLDY